MIHKLKMVDELNNPKNIIYETLLKLFLTVSEKDVFGTFIMETIVSTRR